MPSLRELEAEPLKREVRDGSVYHRRVTTLAEADGVLFLCPVCFQRNGGPVGTHSVICWFRGKVPDDAVPGPGRWTPRGTNIDNFSLEPSVQLLPVQPTPSHCAWHGFVGSSGVPPGHAA